MANRKLSQMTLRERLMYHKQNAVRFYPGKTWQETFAATKSWRTAWSGNWQKTLDRYQSAKSRVYYADNFAGFREVGTVETCSRENGGRGIDHNGWYMNSFQDDLAVGMVLQMPARDHKPCFIPAVKFTGSDGVNIYLLDQYDDMVECARAADQYAEHLAEDAREYDAKQQAEQEIEDLKQEIVDARLDRRSLLAECRSVRRELAGKLTDYPALTAGIRARLTRLKNESRKAYERIQKLEDNYWEAVS